MISFTLIFSCSDVSKMHNKRILLFFIDTGAFSNNGKCITAVRGTDIPNALKRDCIYNIDMLVSKKGFQAFIYIYYKSFDVIGIAR